MIILPRRSSAFTSGGGALISYVGGDAQTTPDTTPMTISLPAGHQADDFALIFTNSSGNGQVITISSATGWTELTVERSNVGYLSTNYIFYKKLTSSSETDPVLTNTTSDVSSATCMVFRGVDTSTPFDVTYDVVQHYDEYVNQWNVASAPITTVTNNAAIVLFEAFGRELLTAGAPSGYTLGPVVESAFKHEQATAYLLDAGASGVQTPPAWNHTMSGTSSDTRTITLALRAA